MSDATVVVGAGPAGLAVGVCLRQAGMPCLILEQADTVGSAWRKHYDRLHLHTAKAFSALPYLPFPKEYPRYPSRLEVVQYLETYAREFQLEPKFGQQVMAVRRVSEGWEVETQDTRYQALNLVIATGYTRQPYRPTWPGESSFRGALMHSSDYRTGQPFQGQRVLVVGFGNSGGEIAFDLWEHGALPSLAVRGPVNVIPRDLLGIPIQAIAILERKLPSRLADVLNGPILRITLGDLTRYGLRKLPRGPMSQIQHQARIPLIDSGTIELIQRGQITVRPGIERFTESGVRFTDGTQELFDGVILATGFRPRVDAFLEAGAVSYDEYGTPLVGGDEIGRQGLYFCGFHIVPTGMLREIGREAQRIGDSIARNRLKVERSRH